MHTLFDRFGGWKKIVGVFVLAFIVLSALAPVTVQMNSLFKVKARASVAHAADCGQNADGTLIPCPEKTAAAPAAAAPATTAATPAPPPPTTESCNDKAWYADAGCTVTRILTWFLSIIIDLLGRIVMFLVEILLEFARYNGFNSAAPVDAGWSIVRDVCNMFFIVILLISAFSTILQYESSFHYTKVLPKLLMMAILINFSRTLIQLMIDFSQVVMLTFVNAFYQAGAGNFVQALGLQDYLDITKNQAGIKASGTNVVLAYFLAVILLIITVGVLLIFIAFIIGRIVGLWIALIFSPIALFALAVPGKIQKAMSAFTSKYWNKLTSMLTGGPIIAFFLWLTLAIVQKTASSGRMAEGLGLFPGTGHSTFLSSIGNTQGVASFIVAIAMMLMGMDAAMEAAKEVGMGDIAKTIGDYTKGAAKWVATAPYRGAKAAGKAAVVGAAGAAESRLDLTGKLSRLGMRAAAVPGLGALVRPAMPMLVAGAVLGREKREAAAAAKIKGAEKMGYAEMGTMKAAMARDSSPAGKLAYANLVSRMGSEDTQLKETKARAAKYQDTFTKAGHAPDEAKRMANSKAMNEVATEARGNLLAARKEFGDMKMMDKVADIDKIIDKNPQLADPTKFDDAMNKVRLDPDKIKELSASALSRGDVLTRLLPPSAIQRKGGKITGFDQAQVDSFMAQHRGTNLGNNMQSMLNYVGNNNGVPVDEAELNNMVMQRGARGEVKIYNAGSGEYMKNGLEKVADAEIRTEIESEANKGRVAGTNQLTTAAGSSIHKALNAGMGLNTVLDRAGRDDGAVDLFLADALRSAVGAAGRAPAGDKAGLDKAMGIVVNVAPQLEAQGVDSKTQVTMIAGIADGGGANTFATKWDEANGDQRRGMESVVKLAVARAEEAARKRSAGQAVSAEEVKVEKFVADMRTNMPRQGAGKAPPALMKHLY